MKIKLTLSQAEYDPILRTAEAFGCDPEDILFVALDEYMCRLGNFDGCCGPECVHRHTTLEGMRAAALEAKDARGDNLPRWADSAGAVHAYEGMPDDEPAKSPSSRF